MPNNKAPEPGAARAAEVAEAMKNVPGYADDSMFFVARYVDKAKNQLRDGDWEKLVTLTGQRNGIRISGGNQVKAAEMRKQALELIEGFPDLVKDYDQFSTCLRSAASAVWAPKMKESK